ncbi:MAG: UDP-3-O-acyl-N-acetylglucosamine deacetylase [Planctomycetaceae bacterium]
MTRIAFPEHLTCERVARPQQTLARPAVFQGRSLFHGFDVTATILPADSSTGIVFRRTDLSDVPDIPATVESLTKVPRRTALASCKEAVVETVEHLMAALAGLQIDNCVVEIDAPELPSYDGSCRDFCDGILQAGIVQQDERASLVRISAPAQVRADDGRQSLLIRPYAFSCAAITYQLHYGSRSPLEAQTFSAELSPEYFYEHISAARTFVLESEIAALKKLGYGRHLTAKDIVVVDDDGTHRNSLRWPDEAARHKLLDCLGDLALCGSGFAGHVTACRSGHHLNQELAGLLFSLKQKSLDENRQAA